MKVVDQTSLDQFELGRHGDRRERDLWPLVSKRFPSYEVFWRRIIVPLTHRIDPRVARQDDRWIRLRPGIPSQYEQLSMAQYSVFHHLGRALKRLSEDATVFENPEDVFFLLDSIGDNFRRFMEAMNTLGKDCAKPIFDAGAIQQFPRGFEPFPEISAYRDVLLHNPVLGRGIEVGRIYVPRWSANKSESPLEIGKTSWREAEKLSRDNLISTSVLLERLVTEVCALLETCWGVAIKAIGELPFQAKMVKVLGLDEYPPLRVPEALLLDYVQPPSGSFSSLGSNTTYMVQPAFKRPSDK